MLNYIESIKNAKEKIARIDKDDRREKNKAIEEYQLAIKNSPYDWEKINGKEEIARIDNSTIIILNQTTWQEEIIKK